MLKTKPPLPQLLGTGYNKKTVRIHLWQPVGCFALFLFHSGLLLRALYHGRAFISANAGHVGESIFYSVSGLIAGTLLFLVWRKQNRRQEA